MDPIPPTVLFDQLLILPQRPSPGHGFPADDPYPVDFHADRVTGRAWLLLFILLVILIAALRRDNLSHNWCFAMLSGCDHVGMGK